MANSMHDICDGDMHDSDKRWYEEELHQLNALHIVLDPRTMAYFLYDLKQVFRADNGSFEFMMLYANYKRTLKTYISRAEKLKTHSSK